MGRRQGGSCFFFLFLGKGFCFPYHQSAVIMAGKREMARARGKWHRKLWTKIPGGRKPGRWWRLPTGKPGGLSQLRGVTRSVRQSLVTGLLRSRLTAWVAHFDSRERCGTKFRRGGLLLCGSYLSRERLIYLPSRELDCEAESMERSYCFELCAQLDPTGDVPR